MLVIVGIKKMIPVNNQIVTSNDLNNLQDANGEAIKFDKDGLCVGSDSYVYSLEAINPQYKIIKSIKQEQQPQKQKDEKKETPTPTASKTDSTPTTFTKKQTSTIYNKKK